MKFFGGMKFWNHDIPEKIPKNLHVVYHRYNSVSTEILTWDHSDSNPLLQLSKLLAF